mgnify:CR=1 FL=1
MTGTSLTIGHIAYANCEPFFHYLRECGFDGTIRSGVPVDLNRFLKNGEVDLSPSSSFEYLQHWHDYLLLPDLSISSVGEVQSVLLFSTTPIAELKGKEIFLTGESASSVRLLQVLLREYFDFEEVFCRVSHDDLEDLVNQGKPALLIGDRALRVSGQVPADNIYDLGELWHQTTGLPFVFALWIVRKKLAEDEGRQVACFHGKLKQSLKLALADLPGVAESLTGYAWYGHEKLVHYWQTVSYSLGEKHLQGLRLYAELLVKYGFLEQLPEIKFFDPSGY